VISGDLYAVSGEGGDVCFHRGVKQGNNPRGEKWLPDHVTSLVAKEGRRRRNRPNNDGSKEPMGENMIEI